MEATLSLDRDGLSCWLSSVYEAVLAQENITTISYKVDRNTAYKIYQIN
jgi:hypothetical protein